MFVYADNAATTAVDPAVRDAMLPYFGASYGNPSSLHQIGRAAKAVVDAARQEIAGLLGCDAKELYFTASGTEADNWAIRSVARAKAKHSMYFHKWKDQATYKGPDRILCFRGKAYLPR